MTCEKLLWEICLVSPSSGLESSIFGFAEFISALALLVIVYTITDIRYKFRVAIAPTSLLPLFDLTYCLIGVIGFGTLMTDLWLSEQWLIPYSLISQPVWRGIGGGFFLLLAMTWIYYAFINPPIYNKKNFKKFGQVLYQIIVKGSESELPVIASELARSAESLVQLSKPNSTLRRKDTNQNKEGKKRKPDATDYADSILSLIANRKLCRHIIASSPGTAIAFFSAMTTNEKYISSIGQFVKNISEEAITNKDSILHHEDEGYRSGLLGNIKPFSQSIYGNYRLVEALGSNHGSPLDISYKVVWSWDAAQLEVYSGAVLITLGNCLESGSGSQHSYTLYNALKNIKDSCRDVYKLKDIPSDYYSTDIYKRLQTAVNFIKEAIDLIDKQENPPYTELRVREDNRSKDFYDHFSDLMFEIIFSAASVKEPFWECWDIQHNTVWSNFFGYSDGKAWGIINFKLRRLLYDEILRMEKFPNYKSSKILGFCLNVMGLTLGDKKDYRSGYYSLHKAVLAWTKNNYLRLVNNLPDVEKTCLMGSISFDEQNKRLVKTYAKGLNLEAPKEYLELKRLQLPSINE